MPLVRRDFRQEASGGVRHCAQGNRARDREDQATLGGQLYQSVFIEPLR